MLRDTGPASNLETTLRNLTEVTTEFRDDLVGAYFAAEGRIVLPRMIYDNADKFTPLTLTKLGILIHDEDADVSDVQVDNDMEEMDVNF